MVDEESVAEIVHRVTNGALADLIIDVSSGGATLIVAASERKAVDGFAIDTLIGQQISLRGVRGHSFQAVEMALALMASHRVELELMSTHEFGLADVDYALRLVEGEFRDNAVHVTIAP